MDQHPTTTQAWRAAIPTPVHPEPKSVLGATMGPISISGGGWALLTGGASSPLGCAAGGLVVFVLVVLLLVLMRPPMALRRREPGCVDPERLCMASTCGWALAAAIAAGSLAYFG